MKQQFDKNVRQTPDWKVGDEVWLDSKNISTTRPSPKLGHRWLGPFNIMEKISKSTYKLNLPLSMKGVHKVFHVSVLRKHNPDTIDYRKQAEKPPIEIGNDEEWEVSAILDCRLRRNRKEYLVNWTGFNSSHDSWEPEGNLTNCKDLLKEFKTRFPDTTNKNKARRRRK